jgi:hypothetical protein
VIEIVILQLALLAFFGFCDVDVTLFNLCLELSRLSAEYRRTYQEKTYQVDRDLNSILSRLFELLDSRFHLVVDRAECLFGLPHAVLRGAVYFLCLRDIVRSLLHCATDVLHAWLWSARCHPMLRQRLTWWTTLVKSDVVGEW